MKTGRKIFRNLVSVDEALRVVESIKDNLAPRFEEVEITGALNRVLAEDVYAGCDVPPFDRAAMDGYAVRAEDTYLAEEDNPVRLRVTGSIETGENPNIEVGRGEAVRIATGAVMPAKANAVVMVEYTSESDGVVEVYRAVAPGENVVAAGSDVMAGELIARAKTRITAREAGILAAVGVGKVRVYEKPKVAVISTGNEVEEWGRKLEPGKIYDVNTATISLAVEENGGEVVYRKIARDSYDSIRSAIEEAVRKADIVITSGGTSAGEGDIVYRVLGELGEVLVHGIAVKPGKPAIIAVVDGKPVFGLPGYPTSAFMIFEKFVSPVIRHLAGMKDEKERKVRARLAVRIASPHGRREFHPVCLVEGEEGLTAYPLTGNYSAMVSKLAQADGFVEIGENVAFLEPGEVEVTLFSTLRPSELVIIGSHCVGVDLLLRLSGLQAKTVNAGSTGGLLAVRRGEADLAGTHLLDESGEYNLPVMRRLGMKNAVLVKGYLREQGLIVARGNPKNIRWFEDMLRDNVRIVNRNPGSGTRVLLDMHLREIAEREGIEFEELVKRIDGYSVEAKTHTAVAVAILMGKADVGLGIKSVADFYGLDFIPVRAEEYDFAVRKDRLEKESVRMFLDTLRSEEFARELEKLGMRTWERTGEVVYL